MRDPSRPAPEEPEEEAPIEALLSPASVAVVGASPSSYVGRVLCENLRALGYGGRVFPVNPRYDEVLGWRSFPSLEALPEAPEAVATAVRIRAVPDLLRAAGRMGTRAAVVPGGGYTETGPQALLVQEEIGSVAREFGMAVAGPNCMGVIAPPAGAALYIGTIPPSLLPGRVALVSQSGSVVEAAVNMGPRVGFSALVSCGNEAATTVGDYLRFFSRHETTIAVALFVEGFRDPQGFVAGARALREAGKPLAVLHAGRSVEAAPAVVAHSGTLAGSDEVVTGLLHQLGAIGVDDIDELFEVAELLGHGRLPRGRRLFAVTDSGGEGNLVRDQADRLGLELPSPSASTVARLKRRWPNFAFVGNPIDPWGVDPDYQSLYGEILAAASREDVDVVAVALDKVSPWAGSNETHLGQAAADALVAATAGSAHPMPVFLTVHSTGPATEPIRDTLREAGVPLLHGLRPALAAIRRAWYWGQWRRRTPSPAAGSSIGLPDHAGSPGGVMSEWASREVLAAYGIPLVPGRRVGGPAEAERAARALGGPVVVKADAPGVAHKAAAGMVRVGVLPDQAGEAFGSVMAAARRAGASPEGALVESTARGVELICGMRRDSLFGPVVLLGLGGTLAEAFHDVAARCCPVSPEDLEEMPGECSAGLVLAAAGASPEPVLAVVEALSRLATEHPEVREVDVNPLFAGPDGVAAADALVVTSGDADEATEPVGPARDEEGATSG